MMPKPHRNAEAAAAYDAVAEAYAAAFFGELARKPFDRELLGDFVASLPAGRTLDIGCGPGHVTRYLAARGVDVLGVDLSPQMVASARRLNPRRLNPTCRFEVGDMRALNFSDDACAGIIAFYSIIHLGRTEIVSALREFRRLLCPGGRLLVSFHIGVGETHLETWFEKPVKLDFTFFGADEMTGYAEDAGFAVEMRVRPPYPFEVQTERGYILAENPAGPYRNGGR